MEIKTCRWGRHDIELSRKNCRFCGSAPVSAAGGRFPPCTPWGFFSVGKKLFCLGRGHACGHGRGFPLAPAPFGCRYSLASRPKVSKGRAESPLVRPQAYPLSNKNPFPKGRGSKGCRGTEMPLTLYFLWAQNTMIPSDISLAVPWPCASSVLVKRSSAIYISPRPARISSVHG